MNKLLGMENRIMKNVYAHVKAVVKNDNKFLIIQTVIPGGKIVWDLPGGRVDFGEDPYESLKRELREEVNISVKTPSDFLGMYWFFRYDGHQAVCSTFLYEVAGQDVDLSKNSADENIIKYKWVTKDKFLEGKYEVGHKSLKKLITNLS